MEAVPKEKIKHVQIAAKGQFKAAAPGETTSIGVWRPLPNTQFKHDAPLSQEEEEAVTKLKEYVAAQVALAESDSYYKWERRFLDVPNCYARFLRASNWKMEEAKSRITETLEWRRDYKPDLIPPTEIAEETAGGKIVVSGFDKMGRPIMYLRPARENTDPSPTQIRHLVFQLERAIDLLPDGVSKVFLIIDYAGATTSSSPSIKTSKTVIDILQKHYCERLGKAVVCRCPWYLKGLFQTISPFLDPVTKKKLEMNPDLTRMVPAEQLDADFGGKYKFEYDYQIYLPAICQFCGIKDDGTRSERPPMFSTLSTLERSPESVQAESTQAESSQSPDEASTSSSLTAVNTPQEGVVLLNNKPKVLNRVDTNASIRTTSTVARSTRRMKRSLIGCFRPTHFDEDADVVQGKRRQKGTVNAPKVRSVHARGRSASAVLEPTKEVNQQGTVPHDTGVSHTEKAIAGDLSDQTTTTTAEGRAIEREFNQLGERSRVQDQSEVEVLAQDTSTPPAERQYELAASEDTYADSTAKREDPPASITEAFTKSVVAEVSEISTVISDGVSGLLSYAPSIPTSIPYFTSTSTETPATTVQHEEESSLQFETTKGHQVG